MDSKETDRSMSAVMLERTNGVVVVTLSRPRVKNALDGAAWAELLAVLRSIEQDRRDRLLIVTGAGDAFCSGADISPAELRRWNGDASALPGAHQLALMRDIGEVARTLYRSSTPTIAMVNGVAVGGGCGLALACDLVVAAEEATFVPNFSRRCLSPDVGVSWILPRLIGLQRSKALLFRGSSVSANEALSLGLVTRVVPRAELAKAVQVIAEEIVAGPLLALALTKRMLNDSFAMSLEQALEDEARSQAINMRTDDFAEAMSAFQERRTPWFKGH